MATKLQDGNTPCLAATPSEPRPTVLVFDSGVGGLSVYDEIRHLLPDLHYIYAFDNVAFPYGEKSEEFIVERSYTHELIARFANECQIEMLGSAEMVELAEAKLHGEDVSLDALKRILRPWLRMKEPPDTVVLGCTHFPLLQEELLQVLPEGTRLVDSGAAIARRTAWLLEHEAPDAKSADANIAFCMAMTPEAEQLLPVLQRYGFETLEKLAVLG